ncbi:hypothetical protein B0H16DRAFT_1702428 [Mycena metata]|uniref:Carboxylesterase type B domain-containing protein n=1 Tax=Mycena metata TaxID=1033252 RepID=A0AAD7MEG1_9AGAR|nr:hypothetical protein B0H16DRAFT_1702428 [Mycena metata]
MAGSRAEPTKAGLDRLAHSSATAQAQNDKVPRGFEDKKFPFWEGGGGGVPRAREVFSAPNFTFRSTALICRDPSKIKQSLVLPNESFGKPVDLVKLRGITNAAMPALPSRLPSTGNGRLLSDKAFLPYHSPSFSCCITILNLTFCSLQLSLGAGTGAWGGEGSEVSGKKIGRSRNVTFPSNHDAVANVVKFGEKMSWKTGPSRARPAGLKPPIPRPVSPPTTHLGNVNASNFATTCIATTQTATTSTTSEDCLFGNIYLLINTTPTSALPVLIYFYGGGFEGGEAREFTYLLIFTVGYG